MFISDFLPKQKLQFWIEDVNLYECFTNCAKLVPMSLLLITQLPDCIASFTGRVLFNLYSLLLPVNRTTLRQFMKACCNS